MYKVDITSQGDFRFKASSKGHEFMIDAKGAEGITPPDVLLASLASCVGIYLRKYAEGAKLPIGEFTVSAESDLGAAAPYRFSAIKVTVDLKGAAIEERRRKAMLDFIRNCPIHNTLKAEPSIDISVL